MRSWPERRLARLAPVVLLATLCLAGRPAPAAAQQNDARPPAATIDRTEIARAIDGVRNDPNLTPSRTMKLLRWKDSGAKPRSVAGGGWIAGLFEWIAQSARVLLWLVAIALGAMAINFLARLARARGLPEKETVFVAPTHVRDLDIRPETLPADIGGAARALWDRGETRAALALLYRGLLSRLVHVHRVAIRDSSTEGDCLMLASSQLEHPTLGYVSRLVAAWQRSVYGHEVVSGDEVRALCDNFAAMLDRARPASMASGAAA